MSSIMQLISQRLHLVDRVNRLENKLLHYGQLIIYLAVLLSIFFIINSMQASLARFLSGPDLRTEQEATFTRGR